MSDESFPPAGNFESALKQLADPKRTPDTRLVLLLSGPSSVEVGFWQQTWVALDLDRRRWIAQCLLETAEASFEVDFRSLFVSLLDDGDCQVRAMAIDGLSETEDARLVDRFAALVQHDPFPEVRARAAAGLGQYVLLAELGEIDGENVTRAVTALVTAANDESEDVEVRRRATESAGYADRTDVHALIQDGIDSSEHALRVGAMLAMGRSADSRWGPIVIQGLTDPHPELRLEAARAAGELTLSEAVPALFTIAQEDSRETMLEAVWALGEIGGRAAERALERIAAQLDDDAETATAVDDALAMAALGEGEVDWLALGLDRPKDRIEENSVAEWLSGDEPEARS